MRSMSIPLSSFLFGFFFFHNQPIALKREEYAGQLWSDVIRSLHIIILSMALSRNQVKLGFLLAINCFIP
ncbi:MAG TPA: hypothetical protein PLS83_04955, partial [Methanothrix soehngenii]|nr:hypothetical protein [Methanothrix soehngenii]